MEDMLTYTDVDVCELNCSIINCRKITLRTNLCMRVRVYSNSRLEVVSDIEGACMKKEHVISGIISATAQSSATLTDSFELPAGKAPVKELLKTDAYISESEIKVIDDKTVIKGCVRISTLYKTDNSIEYAQTEIPFAHVMEANGIRSDMEIEYSARLIDVDASTNQNNDGITNVFDFSLELLFMVLARTNISCEVVTDAFTPHENLECKKTHISVDNIETVIHNDTLLREKITLDESAAPIETVYQLIARPFTENCRIEENALVVTGYCEVYILYLSSDKTSPVCSYKTNIDFSVRCDSPSCNIVPDCDCMLKNISYTLSSDKCVEVRANIDVSVTCVHTTELDVVYGADYGEYESVSRPSIIISCISQGRSLWDIAKHYSVDPSAILSANALESENDIPPHASLIIPK